MPWFTWFVICMLQLNETNNPSMSSPRWLHKSLEECLDFLGPKAYPPPGGRIQRYWALEGIIVVTHGVLLASLILCCKTHSTHSWLCVCHSRATGPALLCIVRIVLAAYRQPATFFKASSSYGGKLVMCIKSEKVYAYSPSYSRAVVITY